MNTPSIELKTEAVGKREKSMSLLRRVHCLVGGNGIPNILIQDSYFIFTTTFEFPLEF